MKAGSRAVRQAYGVIQWFSDPRSPANWLHRRRIDVPMLAGESYYASSSAFSVAVASVSPESRERNADNGRDATDRRLATQQSDGR